MKRHYITDAQIANNLFYTFLQDPICVEIEGPRYCLGRYLGELFEKESPSLTPFETLLLDSFLDENLDLEDILKDLLDPKKNVSDNFVNSLQKPYELCKNEAQKMAYAY
jgi:hypothetical protein